MRSELELLSDIACAIVTGVVIAAIGIWLGNVARKRTVSRPDVTIAATVGFVIGWLGPLLNSWTAPYGPIPFTVPIRVAAAVLMPGTLLMNVFGYGALRDVCYFGGMVINACAWVIVAYTMRKLWAGKYAKSQTRGV